MEAPIPPHEDLPEKPLRISARLSAQSVLSAEELARTIGEVRTAAEQEQARLSHPLAATESWYRRPVVAGVLVALAAVLWGVQLWAWHPDYKTPSPLEREGALRFQVVRQVAAIEEFRNRTGRLPASTKELSVVLPGMTYQLLDTLRYRVTMHDSLTTVSWRSDSSLSAFVGGSLIRMRDAGKLR
ncbi:MAG: hypothetical protein HY275_06875 [Gemmatimonadetes bacterium]|nr:hypothetical protein [Gemmatimonadota bacterium]